MKLTKPRARIVQALSSVGGSVEHNSGRATAALAKLIYDEPTAKNHSTITNLLRAMDRDGLVERDVNGTCTYAIRLSGVMDVAVPEPEPEPPPPDLAELAMELLVQVSTVLAGESDASVKQRLADSLAGRARAEATVRELGEQMVVLRAERDGLKARQQGLEANVRAMLKGELNDRTYREVERFMQARPSRR